MPRIFKPRPKRANFMPFRKQRLRGRVCFVLEDTAAPGLDRAQFVRFGNKVETWVFYDEAVGVSIDV